MIILVSFFMISALIVLALALIEPALIANHLPHVLGLHKLFPEVFEHPHLLKNKHSKIKR